MVSVLDYGLGNLASIVRMIELVGGEAEIVTRPEEIAKSRKLILPGVGNFDYGMSQINSRGLSDALQESVFSRGIYIMGICLGMQLLCKRSQEGVLEGLGYVDAEVYRFQPADIQKYKVPHMGWNTVKVVRSNPLVDVNESAERFYFVHSYYVASPDNNIPILISNHGIDFCAAFQKDNIFGVQFHPEKSHKFGMKLMKRFVEL